MNLLPEFAHLYLDHIIWLSRGADNRRDGQGIYVTGKLYTTPHLWRGGHCHARLAKSYGTFVECKLSYCA